MAKLETSHEVAEFVKRIRQICPPPSSVWLIGSRANGRATESSDTDLLVMGSTVFLEMLRDQVEAPGGIDCLVVYDGNNYKDPWQDKSGSLEKLAWTIVSEDHASYIGTQWIPDEESSREFDADMGQLIHRNECGIRVWPPRSPKP
jgi:hypothetical protein